jgi:hypothetical protein
MNEETYTEQELESSYLNDMASRINEASYFERAQNFQAVIKGIRMKYLCLKPKVMETETGESYVIYTRDDKRNFGMNKEGVEAMIRFLELRMGQHVALTNWSEERMMQVYRYDLLQWRDHLFMNYEAYELTPAGLFEMATLVADQLEYVYRRGVDDAERSTMRPIAKEIRRILGLDEKEEKEMQTESIQQLLEKMKRENTH